MAYVAIPQKRLRVKAVGDLLEPTSSSSSSSTGTDVGHHRPPTKMDDGDTNVGAVQDQKHKKQEGR